MKKLPTLRELGQDKRIKLSEADIAKINRLYEEGRSQASLAREFGVSIYCIKYHLFPEFAKQNNTIIDKIHKATRNNDPECKRQRVIKQSIRFADRKYYAQKYALHIEHAMKEYLTMYSPEDLALTLAKLYIKVTKEKENV